ncbi:MAG: flagellar hook-associated protein FlgK [Planctomycetaceae bacterium]
MSHIDIGISALRAAQVGLTTTAQNIANASTTGYHRQQVNLVDRRALTTDAGWLVGGVDVGTISRLRDATIEQALTANVSGQAGADIKLQALQRIEQALTPSDTSIHALVTEFFDRVDSLATNPAETVLRRELIATASQLASAINDISSTFDGLQGDIRTDIVTTVDRVNELADQIVTANRDIRLARSRGTLNEPNSLLDKRDRLINELAGYVDIDPTSLLSGGDPLVAAGGGLVIGEATSHLTVEFDVSGRLQLASTNGQKGIDVRGGVLGGLLDGLHSVDLGLRQEFDSWVSTLISRIDTIQATGIGLNGPAGAIIGQRSIQPPDLVLARTDSLFGLQSGDLTLTITDASGTRTSHVISVDVNRDTLQDVVSRLDAIPGLTAELNTDEGTVSLHAATGFGIDFAGRTDPTPVTQAITGTARPVFGGVYSGDSNANWNVEVISGGEIGVSDGVLLRVTDATTGAIVGDYSVGRGYAASQPFEIADGITLALGAGTLNTGDTFSTRVTADPDQTGLLANLGLQTFFAGRSFSEFSIHPDLQASPEAIAASRTGGAGEGRQLDRLIELRGEGLFSAGGENIEERLATITGISGVLVTSVQREIDQRSVKQSQLEDARDSISGVDPNEELLQMLKYQRSLPGGIAARHNHRSDAGRSVHHHSLEPDTMPFRITPFRQLALGQSYSQAQTVRLADLRNQISSGIRVHKPSDDPRAQKLILDQQTIISHFDNQVSVIQDVRTVLNDASTEVRSAQQIVVNIKELALQARQISDPAEAAVYADEINGYLKSLGVIANSRHDSRYLFAGSDMQTSPYPDVSQSSDYLGAIDSGTTQLAGAGHVKTYLSGLAVFTTGAAGTTVVRGTTGATGGPGTASGHGGWNSAGAAFGHHIFWNIRNRCRHEFSGGRHGHRWGWRPSSGNHRHQRHGDVRHDRTGRRRTGGVYECRHQSADHRAERRSRLCGYHSDHGGILRNSGSVSDGNTVSERRTDNHADRLFLEPDSGR